MRLGTFYRFWYPKIHLEDLFKKMYPTSFSKLMVKMILKDIFPAIKIIIIDSELFLGIFNIEAKNLR